MRRHGTTRGARRALMLGWAWALLGGVGGWSSSAWCAEVSGTVRAPEVCSTSVSPAVVYLEPIGAAEALANGSGGASQVALVNQRGLRFEPRVQAAVVGQRVRFVNQDGETHNVHVVSPGAAQFNQSMSPGDFREFHPDRPGVLVLACDIHTHMRGYVLVSATPWVGVCSASGRFRIDGVPDGRYTLHVWQEMAEPISREIAVENGAAPALPDLVLSAAKNVVRSAAPAAAAPVRRWPEVIDRIGMLLTASHNTAMRKGEYPKARRLAEDAYWGEFEASDMETAVRRHLGYARAGELEQEFRHFRAAVRDVAEGRSDTAELERRGHQLLLDLVLAARELDVKGVSDRTRIDAVEAAAPSEADLAAAAALGQGEAPKALLARLRVGFQRVVEASNASGADEAASELTTVYMTEFEPIERYLLGRAPQSIRPLEAKFNVLRGDLAAGLGGEALAGRLDGMFQEVDALVGRLEARPTGTFGTAFLESFITIAREGLEIILVLAMLIAVVVKAAGSNASGAEVEALRRRSLRAIWFGVGLAIVASLGTAWALHMMVGSLRGQARELLEGAVMLVAGGVLFYVSYWLVSQAEAKRWMDFLRTKARHGLQWGGRGTLALTAFLAVYREGAETSLMYQALLSSQGQTRAGLFGLAAGLGVGLMVLAVVAVVIRASSVRLPIQTFFRFSGLFLFALAVIFAGTGVFELQNAGVLLTTHLAWLGDGLPMIGLYPNVQVASVQGLLVLGALLAWAVVPRAALNSSAGGGAVPA